MKKIDIKIKASWIFLSLFIGNLILVAAEKPNGDTIVSVRRGQIEGKLTWRGVVRSAKRIEVRADKKIKIGKVHVKNTDYVKKGQLLIEVDTADAAKKKRDLQDSYEKLKFDFESSRVKFQQGQKNLGRKNALAERGILSVRELEEAQRDYKILENDFKSKQLEIQKAIREVNQVETELKAASFLAPQDGVVQGLWNMSGGSNEANGGQSLVTIIDPKSLALWVQVEETHLSLVGLGKEVWVSLDVSPGKKIKGTIFELSTNASDSNARIKSYGMGISFDANGLDLKEGFSGEGTFVYAKRDNTLVVPISAIKYLDGKDYLVVESFGLSGQKAVPVKIGLKTDTEVEILSGVKDSDKVVITD